MYHSFPWQRLRWLISWFILITSFCTIGFLLVAQATGYRYNPHLNRWQKTGMILAASSPRDATLHLGRQQYDLEKIRRITNVLPGHYTAKITKEGYISWEKTLTIEPGFVENLGTVLLFLQEPVRTPATEVDAAYLENVLPDDRVRIVDGELRHGTSLVSRFADAPTTALLLPTGRHIVYVQGQEIRVIETTGQNDQLLYTRESSEPTPLALANDNVILYKDTAGAQALQIY